MNKEYNFVKKLVAKAPRSPNQINDFFKSDAEVLKVGSRYLCTSVDTISEEISMGLIRDPKTLGWLSAVISFSDLAAVGVAPQFLSITKIASRSGIDIDENLFREGIDEACKTYDVNLSEFQNLTGHADLITSAASALVDEKPSLFRLPLKVGDQIYSTGPLGLGNAVAFANVAIRSKSPEQADALDKSYRPQARVREVQLIKKYSHACLDTSDGGLFSFDLMASLNSLGIEIDYNQSLVHPLAQQISKLASVNPFIFFAAQNGEFELLFAIAPEVESEFIASCKREKYSFIKAGRVVQSAGLSLRMGDRNIKLDMSSIQNMLYDRTSADQYILALLKFASFNNIEGF